MWRNRSSDLFTVYLQVRKVDDIYDQHDEIYSKTNCGGYETTTTSN